MSGIYLLVGCGGWHYFKVLNEDPLKMYSLAFRFVEVNSTFYTLPSLETIVSWRERVPLDFEFTVKANRIITHLEALRLTNTTLKALEEMLKICRILNSKVLVLETPKNLDLRYILQNLKSILGEVKLNEVRVALEPRCGWYSGSNASLDEFQSMGIIPVTDYSREEPPYDDEEISYSRLFGLGEHNVYQFTDEDLKLIKERADRRKSKKVYLSFHGISMYLDAARMERFIKKSELPPVTSSYGIDSLAEVLRDAVFPITKNELVKKHGWKLIDVDSKTRVPASVVLKQLRKESYRSINDVLAELRRRFEK
jgi:uncharacterized protein YecE (DUF72 family)